MILLLVTITIIAVKGAAAREELSQKCQWEQISNGVRRTKTPEGWLVIYYTHGITHVPDIEHKWLEENHGKD